MKTLRWIIAFATLAVTPPAHAGINDPEVIIYRYFGVVDNGGPANTGAATVFLCTNYSGVSEIIRIVLRQFNNTLLQNSAFTLGHLETLSAATHNVNLTFINGLLTPNTVVRGTAAIAATSTSIGCTAMLVDAASAAPAGVKLHGVRLNPVPVTQE